MRTTTAAITLGFAIVAGSAFAAGSGSSPNPAPRAQAAPMTKAEQATIKYNNGIRHLESADDLTRRLAEGVDDPKKAQKMRDKQQKEYEKAVKDFENATRLDETNHKAHSSLGYGLRKLGNYDDSLAAYDKALELSATYAPAIEYRAEAYLAIGRLEDVKSAYMYLFTADRARADELEAAMTKWVEERMIDPAGLDKSALDEFAGWVEKRQQIAAQTSSLSQPKKGVW